VESCYLTTDPDACSSSSDSTVSWVLDDSNNERLFDATEHYIYTVSGLRPDDMPSPCTKGYTHRWIKISDDVSSCDSAGVDEDTRNTLENWLDDYGQSRNDYIVDVNLKSTSDSSVCNTPNTKGMTLIYDGGCFKHSHPDEWSVYDFTYWTLPNTHPGNAGASENPIKKWIDNNFRLEYPSWHPMSRWENEKGKFDYLGRFGDDISFRSLPGNLRLPAVLNEFGDGNNQDKSVVVCGSPGEVKNDKTKGNIFQFSGGEAVSDYVLHYLLRYSFTSSSLISYTVEQSNIKSSPQLAVQKSNAWMMIALQKPDQLRQRVAWALSQILVITPNQITAVEQSEIYLNYYDIFVRHAFSSYKFILKEVAYSPMMGEMLSYLKSKSTSFVLDESGSVSYPDENFAR
jgi:cullin-associated NEDD8-dissociated protein 1